MTFRFDKLTIKAQEAVAPAQNLATETGHPEVDAIHLLQRCSREPTVSYNRSSTRSASIATS